MEEIKIPKNVRQIGRAVQGNEIYIEDYVITFARKQARKQVGPQLAVLLGRERKQQGEPLFISGAVLVENFYMESTLLLSNENWSQVYEEIRKYFSELEIVGCLFIRSMPGEEINDRIRRFHKENFGGVHKVLFLYDGEENEECFYLSDGTMLRKQEGFYIYYEKNEPMQEYMIGRNESISEEPLFDDKAMKRVRETIAAKPERKTHPSEHKMLQMMYGASTVLAAAVLVIGVTMLDSHDKMENMETTLNTISDKVDEVQKSPVEVETVTGSAEKSSNEEMKEELVEKEKEKEEQKEEKEKQDEKEEEKKEEKKDEEEAKEMQKKVTYYTVKEGETLISISIKKYNTTSMVEKIQEMNAIDDKDKIYAGQKIILP